MSKITCDLWSGCNCNAMYRYRDYKRDMDKNNLYLEEDSSIATWPDQSNL